MQVVSFQKLNKLSFRTNESYKALRTNVRFCGSDTKVVALTSTVPNEGKSSVSFNLARCFAEDGKLVCFVDADIRKSVIRSRYRISTDDPNPIGLAHHLAGQAELEEVKPCDFADATLDEVMPGVSVVVETPSGEKTYSVLGEWDNDIDLGILSSKTRLAQNMLGKKPGDEFELPGAEGAAVFAKIKEIRPLADEIREWMKLPDGVQI